MRIKAKTTDLKKSLSEKFSSFSFNIDVAFAALCVLFFATRLYKLGIVPRGIHADELGAAFDAECIASYGVDRYRTRYPVYFLNSGAGQNALYTYLASLLFRFFDFSLRKFRLIAVLCGFAALCCTYLLSKLIVAQKKYALTAPALMTVMPIFLMSERWGLESYLFLSFIIISLFFLTLSAYMTPDNAASDFPASAFAHQSSPAPPSPSAKASPIHLWIISGIFFGLTFYTYGVTYVVLPLFTLTAWLYLMWLKKIALKETLAFGVPFCLLGLPLAIEQLVNAGVLPEFQTPFSDFYRMQFFRGGEFALKEVHKNLANIWFLFSGDSLSYNASPSFGTLYYISVPLLIFGLIVCVKTAALSIRKRKFDFSVLLLLFFIVSFCASMLMKKPNINRVNELYAAFLFFTAYAINALWSKMRAAPIAAAIVYACFFIPFCFHYYGGSYDREVSVGKVYYLFIDTSLGEAVRTLSDLYNGERTVRVIASQTQDTHLLIAAYMRSSPYEYEKDGTSESGYEVGLPDELDMSHQTLYVIEKNLSHISGYLAQNGFTVDNDSFDEYSLVY